jgi:hypothetical protein
MTSATTQERPARPRDPKVEQDAGVPSPLVTPDPLRFSAYGERQFVTLGSEAASPQRS